MTVLLWYHNDALRISHPVTLAAGEDAYPFAIWDDDYLKHHDYGTHKALFVYEALYDMQVDIYHGATCETVRQLAQEKNAHSLYVAQSPDPWIKNVLAELESSFEQIYVIDDELFAKMPNDQSYKRFFKYWKKAQKTALLSDAVQ